MLNLREISVLIDKKMGDFYYELGKRVATRPWLTIVACLLLTVVCSLGFLAVEEENAPENLYTPLESEAVRDRDYVESVWGESRRTIRVYITSPTESVLTSSTLLSLLDLYNLVSNHTVEYEGETLTYPLLCRRVNGACEDQSVLDLFQYNRTLIASLTDDQILAAVNQDVLLGANGERLSRTSILGGVTSDSNGTITSAYSAALLVYLESNSEKRGGLVEDFRAREWETSLAGPVFDMTVADTQTIDLFSDGGFTEASDSAITNDTGILPIGYVLMLLFATLVLARRNRIYSQSLLAALSVFCVGASTAAGFGIAALFTKFSLVVNAAMFLMLGLGLDDTFVIISALRRQDPNLSIVERVAETLREAGPAITVTSITDMTAFVAGTYTTMPAIEIFCTYSALGVLFDFAFQSTLFVAFMTLDLRRQQAKRMDTFCCVKLENDESRDCVSKDEFDHSSQGQITTKITGLLSKYVLHPVGKVVILLVASGMLGCGLYGALQLEKEFDRNWFIPDDGNYIDRSLSMIDEYYDESSAIIQHSIFTKSGDYHAAMGELSLMSDTIPQIQHIEAPTITNWFTTYQSWLATMSRNVTSATFVPWLREFLDSQEGRIFQELVLFDSDNTTILSTRIPYLCQHDKGTSIIESMDDGRGVAGLTPSLDSIAYHFSYLFMDGLKVIDREFIRNLILAGTAVLFICLLLLANVPLALLIIVIIIVIDIELLAWAYFNDLYYNAVTVINGLVAVGIAVDYNVHIAHAFMTSTGTRHERAGKAIEKIGGAVMSGAMSTFLAVSVLGTAKSYIFHVFFIMLTGLIVISVFHGMCVLPVLLSFFGPLPYSDLSEEEAEEGERGVVKDNLDDAAL